MNLAAFANNWVTAKNLCPRFIDRLKYLLWLYEVSGGAEVNHKSDLTISFILPVPVGHVILDVRLNKGSDAFIFSEAFTHRYYDFDLPSEPKTILDLGANIGFTMLFFARKYPLAHLAAVEPIPANIELLRQNLQSNGVEAEIFAKAVAVKDGVITMRMSEHDYGHKVADISFGRAVDGNECEVPAVTIPSLLTQLGWDRVGLLKIDIEGYEGILLQHDADWLRRVDALCIEIHEGFTSHDLGEIAARFEFEPPQRLPGTWLLIRADGHASRCSP